MNLSTVLGIILLLAGAFVFLFIEVVIGVTVIVVGVIVMYFGRSGAAGPRQTGP